MNFTFHLSFILMRCFQITYNLLFPDQMFMNLPYLLFVLRAFKVNLFIIFELEHYYLLSRYVTNTHEILIYLCISQNVFKYYLISSYDSFSLKSILHKYGKTLDHLQSPKCTLVLKCALIQNYLHKANSQCNVLILLSPCVNDLFRVTFKYFKYNTRRHL